MKCSLFLASVLKTILFLTILVSPFFIARCSTYTVNYYVSTTGSDSNPGTLTQPWKTIQKALNVLRAGDSLYIRGGEYPAIYGGFVFAHSGTEAQPITVTNFPGEQAVVRMLEEDGHFDGFRCWDDASWPTPHADYIRLLGTDVTPRPLYNGLVSVKGIVIEGRSLTKDNQYSLGFGILGLNCNHWEIAGLDIVDTAAAISTKKLWTTINGERVLHDTTDWYVHDNRVYGFYEESGMQFNGDQNVIEKNEIQKVHSWHWGPYGCQMLNLLGYGNIVRKNLFSATGSTETCHGILFEWDLSDDNLIEQNVIRDAWGHGITFAGGDNNMIRNNLIINSRPNAPGGGIGILSADSGYSTSNWWCDNEPAELLPPPNVSDPEYYHYWEPRNCHSYGNKIYNNVIIGYPVALLFYPLVAENTEIRNNAFMGWTWEKSICFYEPSGTCQPLPDWLAQSNNVDTGDFGFVDPAHQDFHLAPGSPLIDAGYNLGSLVPDDFDSNPRPQGAGFDIGAYEFIAGP